jgi:tRNA(adenine34) deaminase
VYASGEPCAMCSGAMFWAGIRRIVFAASTESIKRSLGGPSLPITSAQTLANAVPSIEVNGPLMQFEAVTVLLKMGKHSEGRKGS